MAGRHLEGGLGGAGGGSDPQWAAGQPGLLATDPMQVPRPLRAAVLLAGCWQVQGGRGVGNWGSPELRHRAVSRGDGGPLLGVFVKDKQYEGPHSPPPPHNTHT